MLLDEAISKGSELIYTGHQHIDYPRTVDIDKDAQTYVSGENIGRLLIQVLKRESEDAFKQRIALTCGITAELFGGLEAPINDVVQNDMVRKGIRLDNERQRLNIEEMFKYWNGSMFNKSNGFDSWLKTRFKDLQGMGANTWIVPEWKTPSSPTEVIRPQPFEVPAEWAWNFEYQNNSLQWLWVAQPIKYLKKKKAEDVKQTTSTHVETPANYQIPFELPDYLKNIQSDGLRYTLYTDTHAVVFEQIDKDYYVIQSNDLDILELKQGKYYVLRAYEHKLGFVPAFRVGYMDDPMTAGRTKVPFWHRAKNTFRNSLLKKSNMDMSEVIQAFPKNIRYVTQCNGDGTHQCNKGYQAGNPGVKCTACKGSGVQAITSTQEEIQVPLPIDPTKENMIDLSTYSFWDAPPGEILEFMAARIKELEPQAHKAVWGTETLIQAATVTKTATEDDNDQKRLQTALEPFAEKISEVYRFFGYLFGKLAGADVNKMDVYYEFQGDLYRRGKAQLINQIKTATDAGAPSFIIDGINETLADVSFAGDPYGRQVQKVQSYFKPFTGMSFDAITYLIETGKVENFYIVLWANYDAIFKELELDNPGFYYEPNRLRQWELIEQKVNEFIALKKLETPEPTLPAVEIPA